MNKKLLPPIEKNNENEEQKEINGEEEKQEEENKENIPIINEPIEKTESCVGTPFFYDIGGLKSDVEEKVKKINEENISQEKYKISLNNLLNDLNKILSENVELLYDEGEDSMKKKKMENINYLQNVLYNYQHQIKDAREKNKTYKQHYEILMKQDETRLNQSAKEYEALIEEKKNDNNNLNKKISQLKQTSQLGRKKLEAYSENVKFPQDINNLSNQLKTLLKKKADYFSKLNKDIKTLSICKKELETLEAFYEKRKKEKNFINPKVEEDIKRLKEDLTGNETEIYNKVQTDQAFIIRKQIHQEKVNSIMKTPVLNKPQKMKLKKGNSLEPLTLKAIRYDVRSGYNSRRMNIVAKNKSPTQNTYEKNNTSNNNAIKKDILEEEDLSNVNYNNLTDFEYRELLTKKEHCYDVTARLEKSIKEAMKMYTRKIKEIKATLTSNSKKLGERQEDNTKLESEIEDLKRILTLTEEEAKLNSMNNLNNNKLNEKNKNNNIDEKELDSQKEYLSPEYYQSNKNKKNMEKKVLSNNDLTGNELLNDLKGLNIDQTGPLISGQGGNKMSNINMKFPDLSNIEEDKPDKNNIVINNEFDRSKAIDDIKKKYNIKKANVEENNDIDLDDNELNFEEKINSDNKKEKEKENLEDINDENKFFKENENILKNEEIGQYEPPIDNEVEMDNINNKELEENNKEENEKEQLITNEKKDLDEVNYKKEKEKEKEEMVENNNNNRYENYINRNASNNNENNNIVKIEQKEKEENIVESEINKEIDNNIEENKQNIKDNEIIETNKEEEILDNKNDENKEEERSNEENKDDINNPENYENRNENNEIDENEKKEEKKENEQFEENKEPNNMEINNEEINVEKEEKKVSEENQEQNQEKEELENENIKEIENQNKEDLKPENEEEKINLNENDNIENKGENLEKENNENILKEEEKKEEIKDKNEEKEENPLENKEEPEENNEEKKEEIEENREERKEETENNNEEKKEEAENNIEEKKEVVDDKKEENNGEKIEGETDAKTEEKKEEITDEKREDNKKEDGELDVEDLQI